MIITRRDINDYLNIYKTELKEVSKEFVSFSSKIVKHLFSKKNILYPLTFCSRISTYRSHIPLSLIAPTTLSKTFNESIEIFDNDSKSTILELLHKIWAVFDIEVQKNLKMCLNNHRISPSLKNKFRGMNLLGPNHTLRLEMRNISKLILTENLVTLSTVKYNSIPLSNNLLDIKLYLKTILRYRQISPDYRRKALELCRIRPSNVVFKSEISRVTMHNTKNEDISTLLFLFSRYFNRMMEGRGTLSLEYSSPIQRASSGIALITDVYKADRGRLIKDSSIVSFSPLVGEHNRFMLKSGLG
jgi:hypothetical protein